jgi:riboflavin kinase/FMN adenylyltransferase
VGTNPTFEVRKRRVEAFILDFDGDLYGERLVVELWRPLREQARFDSVEELVAAIAEDVERARRAEPPA